MRICVSGTQDQSHSTAEENGGTQTRMIFQIAEYPDWSKNNFKFRKQEYLGDIVIDRAPFHAEESAKQEYSIPDTVCPEKYPCDIHKVKGNQPIDNFGDPAEKIAAAACDNRKNTMQDAPEHERPVRTMPESAAEVNYHNIDTGTQTTFSVAAEGNINISCKETGQGFMPAAPEVSNSNCLIRRIKVHG